MTDISSDFLTYLKTKSAITAIVGSGTAARIYPDQIKEGASYPCVVFRLVSAGNDIGIGGKTGIAQAAIEVWAFAESRASSFTLDRTIYGAIVQGNATWNATYTTECTAQEGSRTSGSDPDGAGGDQAVYWSRTTYTVFYTTDD